MNKIGKNFHFNHLVNLCAEYYPSVLLQPGSIVAGFLQYRSHFHCLCVSTDPQTAAVARLSRAEAYTALKQYKLALEDSEFCCATEPSAEVRR